MRVELMSRKGHDVLGEWDRTMALERLEALDREVQDYLRRGYNAFGAASNQRLEHVGPDCEEDVVLIAPVVGG
jgi:hypothetical protein